MPISVLLKKARFIHFVIQSLLPEEIFQSEDLYKAFLPASQTISNHYNANPSSTQKDWGMDGLESARNAVAEIRNKTLWGKNLSHLYFYLAMSRSAYAVKHKQPGNYGAWRSDVDCSILTTGIIQGDGYLDDQYVLLKQLLKINFPEDGKVGIRKSEDKGECETISYLFFGQLQKDKSYSRYGKLFEAIESYSLRFTTISIVQPKQHAEYIFIEHPLLSEREGYDFLTTEEPDFRAAVSEADNYLALSRIVWVLNNGALLKRGSAAVVERIYRTLQLNHAENCLPKYRFPINLDLLAMFTPAIELFTEIFPALFFDNYVLELIHKTVAELKVGLQAQSDEEKEMREIITGLEELQNKFQGASLNASSNIEKNFNAYS